MISLSLWPTNTLVKVNVNIFLLTLFGIFVKFTVKGTGTDVYFLITNITKPDRNKIIHEEPITTLPKCSLNSL